MNNLSYVTAVSIMKNITEYASADFDTLGITEHEYSLVYDNKPWRREHLRTVMKVLNALTFGTLEAVGIPVKIVAPTEYVAAIVATFVAPANRMIACIWLATERQTGVGALQGAARHDTNEIKPSTADQLFALVCELSNNEASSEARKAFQDNLGIAVKDAQFQGVTGNA
ncbi:MAG: external scaffolding protein [Arizlama microvirus]|nr:MAG: external scaffolding protein [Arizlama microvirus]